MQITNATRKLLDDETELKDHHLTVTREDLNDPGVDICAGVRWSFRKREIASIVRLKRQATWTEAAEEYKGDLVGLLHGNKKTQKDVEPFLKYLQYFGSHAVFRREKHGRHLLAVLSAERREDRMR